MINVWVHIENERYWEDTAVLIKLAEIPRIGESVYLHPQTLAELLNKENTSRATFVKGAISLEDELKVIDVCYLEGKQQPHIMLRLNNKI